MAPRPPARGRKVFIRKESLAMAQEIKLPDLGEDAPDEAKVSFWYVEAGEAVSEGDDLVEMVTDKASFSVPSPAGGTVKEVCVAEGDMVSVGQVIAILE
jgi:pyruvate dehydrogenase E2 component (dihydrolipoamide acetyltransferase)